MQQKQLRRVLTAALSGIVLLGASAAGLDAKAAAAAAQTEEGMTAAEADGGGAAAKEQTEESSDERPAAARPEEEFAQPSMSFEEYPRIDGSLACVPLCEALAVRVTGCTAEQAEETMADFTNTNPCYIELAEGRRDILLAYEPAESTKKALEAYDPLVMEPIGKDALVFLVNENNPVESLTREQAYDIYTGKITNWSEVGGTDSEIRAFQRPETSGSQTMMRKLLIGDAPMAEADTEMIAVGMDDIIEVLTEYDNSADALGYSVYYYASEMFRQPGLKFVAVDGVFPSNETISSGEYPLVNEFYCVTNAQSSERAKELQIWLTQRGGQSFVEECGYVPVEETGR